jgi:hypothetical protein
MVGLAFVFLALRASVRVIRSQRPNLSDFFVVLVWFGYCVNAITYTLMSNLQFELSSSSRNTTINISADPEKLVKILKVQTSSPLANHSYSMEHTLYTQ